MYWVGEGRDGEALGRGETGSSRNQGRGGRGRIVSVVVGIIIHLQLDKLSASQFGQVVVERVGFWGAVCPYATLCTTVPVSLYSTWGLFRNPCHPFLPCHPYHPCLLASPSHPWGVLRPRPQQWQAGRRLLQRLLVLSSPPVGGDRTTRSHFYVFLRYATKGQQIAFLGQIIWHKKQLLFMKFINLNHIYKIKFKLKVYNLSWYQFNL